MLTVACVQTGNYYKRGREYVRNLHAAVERHLKQAHRFVCYTDDPFELKGVKFVDISGNGLSGWWNKLKVFQYETLGTVLYLDLDTFIVGPLEPIVGLDTPFAALRDFYRGWGLGSGVVLYNGDYSDIWRQWKRAGRPILPGGDQEWLEIYFQGQIDRLQDLAPGLIHSFKAPMRLESVPQGASIICCHGEPKPHQLNGWTRKHWTDEQPPGTHQADCSARP